MTSDAEVFVRGEGINTLLLAQSGAGFVHGGVFAKAGFGGDHRSALARLPVAITAMDATCLELPDASFDLAWSRPVLEHVRPVERALAEVLRVVRRGVLDIPWGHARLTLEDFRRFVAATEGEKWAVLRDARLRSLHRLGTAAWHDLVAGDQVDRS